MISLKIMQIGNSVGFVLPKEAVARLKIRGNGAISQSEWLGS
jgi:antitoxin component of MazEF toxin-antitoxin module